MHAKTKTCLAAALFVTALVVGLYFAGWLVLWMLGLKSVQLGWNT